VAAGKKLTDLILTPGPEASADLITSTGYVVPTGVQVTQEWTTGEVSGRIGYNSLVYILSSVLGAATPSTSITVGTTATGTLARQWGFSAATTAATTPKTYTLEYGDASRAYRSAHGFFNNLTLSIDRTKAELQSAFIGRKLATGITLTSTPTEIQSSIAMPPSWSVYIDDSGATLGTTKATTVYEAEIALGDRFGVDWPINATETSFSSYVDMEGQTPTSTLRFAADATSDALMGTTFPAGSKKFIRLESLGTTIESSTKYALRIDLCAIITKPNSFDSLNGVEVQSFDFTLAYDTTWGKWLDVKIVNTMTAL
jgi:hypothetical protein